MTFPIVSKPKSSEEALKEGKGCNLNGSKKHEREGRVQGGLEKRKGEKAKLH